MNLFIITGFLLSFVISCSTSTKNIKATPQCIDKDGDKRGDGCEAGRDCNDNDPNNWQSCEKCIDEDGDGFYVGCDRFSESKKEDCDDKESRCFTICEDKDNNGIKDCLQYWLFSFGGGDEEIGYGVGVNERGDGVYFLGNTKSFGKGEQDLVITKFNLKGEIVWQEAIGKEGEDSGIVLSFMNGDQYVLGGSTNSYGSGSHDGWLIFMNEDKILWDGVVGGKYYDEIRDLAINEKYIYFVGYTKSFGAENWDGWIGKVSIDGEVLWQLLVGDKNWDYLECVTLHNGILYAAGYSKIDDVNAEVWIIAIDTDGRLKWSKIFGGGDFDSATDITHDDSYIYLTGFTDSIKEELRDIWIAKLSLNGELIWIKLIDNNRNYDEGRSIAVNGDYIFVGGNTRGNSKKGQDFLIVKLDKEGNIKWNKVIGGENQEELREIYVRDGIYFIGDTRSYGIKSQDILLGKIAIDRESFYQYSCSSMEDGKKIRTSTPEFVFQDKKVIVRVNREKEKIKSGNIVVTPTKGAVTTRCPVYKEKISVY